MAASELHDRAQDVKRCQLCLGKDRKSVAETVCNTCKVNLCKDCVGHHMISSPNIKHDVDTFEFKKIEIIPSYCIVHQEQKCEMFCELCESPICQKCLASGSHENHAVSRISEIYSSKLELIRHDLNELETSIAPLFESILSEIGTMSSSIAKKHVDRQQTIHELGKKCHKCVDNVIEKCLSDSRKMEKEDNDSIQGLKSEFRNRISSIQSIIIENQSTIVSNDSSKILNYTSQNGKFRIIPSRFDLTVPEYRPTEFLEDALSRIIGNIPETRKTCIQGQILRAPQHVLSLERPMKHVLSIDLPHRVRNINIKNINDMFLKIACVPNTDEFYGCGLIGIIKHMNTEGKLLEEITSGGLLGPKDLTVTREGLLMCSDVVDKSINIVKPGKIECLIRLKDWTPDALCSTQTDDLLVYMTSLYKLDGLNQRKIVRYCGFTITQEIQLSAMSNDLKHESLYVPCIEENKNLDIIVSDRNSILVFKNEGQYRFTYDRKPHTKEYNKPFTPSGVTTDSMCQILIADGANNIIHIIDQNGQFLWYINNCDFDNPRDLCADSNDILFVAQPAIRKVKQIKYME
ncbi:uncharacterized protein LOC134243357 [Saccostrea cucullata]|uniref:uncharacterized protein LOC134243357 n=1 Tax=Saccostrea cuccullata TaxID=36930 RepID=UPI002ED26DD5